MPGIMEAKIDCHICCCSLLQHMVLCGKKQESLALYTYVFKNGSLDNSLADKVIYVCEIWNHTDQIFLYFTLKPIDLVSMSNGFLFTHHVWFCYIMHWLIEKYWFTDYIISKCYDICFYCIKIPPSSQSL